MIGNSWEYIAGYNKEYSRTGTCFGGEGGNTEETYKPASGSHFAYNANGTSTKYVTAYSNSTDMQSATEFSDFTSDGKDVSHIGDGIHEVWVIDSQTWFSDWSHFPCPGAPFFERSGGYSFGDAAGIFHSCFDSRYGG